MSYDNIENKCSQEEESLKQPGGLNLLMLTGRELYEGTQEKRGKGAQVFCSFGDPYSAEKQPKEAENKSLLTAADLASKKEFPKSAAGEHLEPPPRDSEPWSGALAASLRGEKALFPPPLVLLQPPSNNVSDYRSYQSMNYHNLAKQAAADIVSQKSNELIIQHRKDNPTAFAIEQAAGTVIGRIVGGKSVAKALEIVDIEVRKALKR